MEIEVAEESIDLKVVLSVCIATYNRCQLCLELVEELLKYPNEDIEVVVSDNASTDDTWVALQGIKDARLKIYRNEKNCGAQFNWINSLWHSSGKYAMNMNDRELVDMQALELLVEELKNRECVAVVACGRNPFDEFNIDTYENRVCLTQKLGEPGDFFYAKKLLDTVKTQIDLQVGNEKNVTGILLNNLYKIEDWYWYPGKRVLKDRPFEQFQNIIPERKSKGYVFTGSPEGQRAIVSDELCYLAFIDDESKDKFIKGVVNAYARTLFWTTWRSRHNLQICKRYGYKPPKCILWIKEVFLWKKIVNDRLINEGCYNKEISDYITKRVWKEYMGFQIKRIEESKVVQVLVTLKQYIFRCVKGEGNEKMAEK